MVRTGPRHTAPLGLKTDEIGFVYYKHVAPTELTAPPNVLGQARRPTDSGMNRRRNPASPAPSCWLLYSYFFSSPAMSRGSSPHCSRAFLNITLIVKPPSLLSPGRTITQSTIFLIGNVCNRSTLP